MIGEIAFDHYFRGSPHLEHFQAHHLDLPAVERDPASQESSKFVCKDWEERLTFYERALPKKNEAFADFYSKPEGLSNLGGPGILGDPLAFLLKFK